MRFCSSLPMCIFQNNSAPHELHSHCEASLSVNMFKQNQCSWHLKQKAQVLRTPLTDTAVDERDMKALWFGTKQRCVVTGSIDVIFWFSRRSVLLFTWGWQEVYVRGKGIKMPFCRFAELLSCSGVHIHRTFWSWFVFKLALYWGISWCFGITSQPESLINERKINVFPPPPKKN